MVLLEKREIGGVVLEVAVVEINAGEKIGESLEGNWQDTDLIQEDRDMHGQNDPVTLGVEGF